MQQLPANISYITLAEHTKLVTESDCPSLAYVYFPFFVADHVGVH